jgi:hypothetical protein
VHLHFIVAGAGATARLSEPCIKRWPCRHPSWPSTLGIPLRWHRRAGDRGRFDHSAPPTDPAGGFSASSCSRKLPASCLPVSTETRAQLCDKTPSRPSRASRCNHARFTCGDETSSRGLRHWPRLHYTSRYQSWIA